MEVEILFSWEISMKLKNPSDLIKMPKFTKILFLKKMKSNERKYFTLELNWNSFLHLVE